MVTVFKLVCGKIAGKLNGKWGNFCCLCFTSVGKEECDAVFVNDKITLELNADGGEALAKILVSVLGNSIAENMSLTETVCRKCALDAIASYKFIQNCKKNTEALVLAAENLSSCLNENLSKTTKHSTLFISVDPTKKSIQRFFDLKEQNKVERTALERFSSIYQSIYGISSPHVNTSLTTGKNDQMKILITRKKMATRRKLSNMRDLSTVSIKTCDLVVDPSNLHEYRCKVCLKEHPSAGRLRAHYFQDHFEQRFPCRECDKCFGTEGRLRSHIQLSHRRVTCSKCGKKISNNATCLQRHEMSHQTRLQKVCHRCGKGFRKITAFEKHMDGSCHAPFPVPHTFSCDHCAYRCVSEDKIITHVRLRHNSIRIHRCPWCKLKFYTAYSLKNHMVLHSHPCLVCGRQFVQETALKNHMRLHTGERPFTCELCGMGFVNDSRRKYHIESRHNSATYECDVCHKVFRAREVIVKHMQRKHPELVSVK